MARLDDTVCVITGAAFGIGRATAVRFAQEGARLVVTDIQEGPLLALADELRDSGAEVEAVAGDVSLVDDARQMIQTAVDRYGRLDVLVANAGIIPLGDILESTVEDWDQVMAVDGRGMWLTCKYAIEAMLPTGGGSIICLSSISGVEGQKRQSTYGPAKFVASGITKHLAIEWADQRHPRQRRRARDDPHRARDAPAGGAGRSRISGGDRADAPHGSDRRTERGRGRHPVPRLRRRLVHHRRHPPGRRRLPGAVAAGRALV